MYEPKEFYVDTIYIGCQVFKNGASSEKGNLGHYVAYSQFLDGDEYGDIGEDIITHDTYHFFEQVKNKDYDEDEVDNKVLFRVYPLKFALGSKKEKVTLSQIKGLLTRMDIEAAMASLRNRGRGNNYLGLLLQMLADLDLMDEGRIKAHYMDRVYDLSRDSIDIIISISSSTNDNNEYNRLVSEDKKFSKIVSDALELRYQLDKEPELIAKKRKRRQ